MTEVINIHPDFRKTPAMKAIINPWLLATINGGLQAAAAFKWMKFRDIATPHKIIAQDGYAVPVWIIRPETLKQPSATLLYLHGSGFMVKHTPQHIANAVAYARQANCCVWFVDYRLAPRYRFPTPFNDCYDCLTWMLKNAQQFGYDSKRIAIGGDSAGGALAAAVAQKARDNGISLCGQLLVYPITDSDCKTVSSTAFANVPPFKQFSMPEVWKTYLGAMPDANPPQYASPIHGKLTNLPPAYVETGEYDPWRDEGAAYAKALVANGIDVELNETKGTVHGFDAVAPDSTVTTAAISRRVSFLQRIFSS